MHRRTWQIGLAVVLAGPATVLAGCSSQGTVQPSTTLASLTSRPVVTTYVTIPSPTTLPLDPTLIDACVDRVQFGAFLGTAEYAELWAVLGQDAVALRAECERFGREDPDRIVRIVQEWADIQAFMTAATTPPPST